MPIFLKPQFNSVWGATGIKIAPSSAKVSQGWVVEIPPYEYDNWSRNRADQMLAHLNQLGVPMWDSTVEYQANKSYVQGTTSGDIYRCLQTNVNIDPELDLMSNWVKAFEVSGTALLRNQNLADIPNKVLARENLGIQTSADYDLRYLIKANNLADVANKASARGNLGLGDSAVRNVGTTTGMVAAGDDSRIVNAASKSTKVVAGIGLTGGGDLSSDTTISLATPSSITGLSGNTVSAGTHTHKLDYASIFPTTYVNFTGSRTSGQTYTNDTGKILFASVTARPASGASQIAAYVNGNIIGSVAGDWDSGGGRGYIFFGVPPGATYRCDVQPSIENWQEMR